MSKLLQHLNRRQRRTFGRLAPTHAVPEGTVLMREGQRGDSFMVLLSGSGVVSANGVPIRHLGPGDFVGELALLPEISGVDGWRTATVTISQPSTVAVCAGADFAELLDRLPLVGGHIVAQAYSFAD